MNKHRGSSFDDFLKEEGLFEECHTEAVKRVIAFQLERELMMKTQVMTKKMLENCTIVDHTLDSEETSSKSLVMAGAE